MRFKIDQNLPLEFERILSSNGHDAISVFNQGLNGATDEKIVSICPEVAEAFPNADAVNKALLSLIKIARRLILAYQDFLAHPEHLPVPASPAAPSRGD